jgi:hypothetical protein
MVDNYDWYKRTVNVIQECNGMERAWDIYIHMISEKKLVHGLRPEMGKEESYLTGRSISRDVAPVLIDKSKGTTGAPAMPIASF